jgi:hypothetical protein
MLRVKFPHCESNQSESEPALPVHKRPTPNPTWAKQGRVDKRTAFAFRSAN